MKLDVSMTKCDSQGHDTPWPEAQNDKNGWSSFPCVKALTRDVHKYQACRRSFRPIMSWSTSCWICRATKGMKKTYEKSALFVAGSRYRLNVARLCDEFLWALPKIAHLWWWWCQLSVIVHVYCAAAAAAAAAAADDDDDDDGQGNVGQEVSWNDPCFSLFSPYLGSILMLTWEQAVDVEFCLVLKCNWNVLAEFFGLNFQELYFTSRIHTNFWNGNCLPFCRICFI